MVTEEITPTIYLFRYCTLVLLWVLLFGAEDGTLSWVMLDHVNIDLATRVSLFMICGGASVSGSVRVGWPGVVHPHVGLVGPHYGLVCPYCGD